MIEIRIDELLEQHGRSFYWLSKQTGVSHTTLWRLKKGRALGINFVTLEKICEALGCEPGELLKFTGRTGAGVKQTGKASRAFEKVSPNGARNNRASTGSKGD